MATRCDEEVAKSVITKCIQKLGYLQLKPEQLKVIMEFVNGRNVFAVLPTGYGKTLCYACLPLIFDELASRTTPSIILLFIYHLCVIMREILINLKFNYIPPAPRPAQLQLTDVTRPFLQRAPPNNCERVKGSATPDYADPCMLCLNSN